MSEIQHAQTVQAEREWMERLESKHPELRAWPGKEVMSADLLKLNVNEHTEKKGNLTYLSWAWAWAEVLKVDPQATWVVHTYGPQGSEQPCMWIGDTAMVHTSVTVKGLRRECLLPVMDHKNNAVKNPDSRKISDAIMRCMTKAISMHGLGLYIYAGEDLPEGEEAPQKVPPVVAASFRSSATMGVFETLAPDRQALVVSIAEYVIERHEANDIVAAYAEANTLIDDERVALAGKLPSHVKTALRKYGESLKTIKKEEVAA